MLACYTQLLCWQAFQCGELGLVCLSGLETMPASRVMFHNKCKSDNSQNGCQDIISNQSVLTQARTYFLKHFGLHDQNFHCFCINQIFFLGFQESSTRSRFNSGVFDVYYLIDKCIIGLYHKTTMVFINDSTLYVIVALNPCGLLMPYGIIELDQRWLR